VGLDVDRETAVAMVMATDDDTIGHEGEIAPPPDTFEAGLEGLFDGMQAVLDARRG
jgi:hypothetical protein